MYPYVIKESKDENDLYNNLVKYVPELKKQLHLEWYYFDIYYKDKIIEYNGDYYHANPKIYNADDFVRINKSGSMAMDIWAKDATKLEIAYKHGYKVHIVWESDYKENKNREIDDCIEFLTKKG